MIILILFAIAVPAVLLRGWVISWMWLWFAVPFGLPPIGMAWAIGISSFVALFMTAPTENKDAEPLDLFLKSMGKMFGAPLLSLGIGWVAHLAMVA